MQAHRRIKHRILSYRRLPRRWKWGLGLLFLFIISLMTGFVAMSKTMTHAHVAGRSSEVYKQWQQMCLCPDFLANWLYASALDADAAFAFEEGNRVRAIQTSLEALALWNTSRRRRLLSFYTASFQNYQGFMITNSSIQACGNIFETNEDNASTLAFSADSRLLATGHPGGDVCVWEVASGMAITSPVNMFAPIRSIAFSPDGRTCLGTTFFEGFIWPFRESTPSRIPSWEPDTQDSYVKIITSSALSSDGAGLAIGRSNGQVIVWDVTHHRYHEGSILLENHIESVAYSKAGRQLVTLDNKGVESTWDTETLAPAGPSRIVHQDLGLELPPELSLAQGNFTGASSPDGKTFVLYRSGNIAWWRVCSSSETKTVSEYDQGVDAAVFSPDGKLILTQRGKTAQCLRVSTLLPIGAKLDHLATIKAMTFIDPTHLITLIDENKPTGVQSAFQIWDARTSKPLGPARTFPGSVLALSDNGAWLMTAQGQSAQVWSTETGKANGQVLKHTYDRVQGALTANGSTALLISGGASSVWSVQEGSPLQRYSCKLFVTKHTIVRHPPAHWAFWQDHEGHATKLRHVVSVHLSAQEDLACVIQSTGWAHFYRIERTGLDPKHLTSRFYGSQKILTVHFPQGDASHANLLLAATPTSLKLERIPMKPSDYKPTQGSPEELQECWSKRLEAIEPTWQKPIQTM